MKIAIIGPAYPFRGGIALHTNLLFENLRKEHNVDIINFKRLYPDFLFPGKTQYEESDHFAHIKSNRIIDSINPLTWYQTKNSIKNNNYDLIIIQFWHPFFAILLGYLAEAVHKAGISCRIIALCHNITSHEGSPIDKMLTKFLFKRIDGFLVQSRSVIPDLKEIVPEADFVYNPHPIYNVFGQPLEKETARQILELDPQVPIILYFGYIRQYKGLNYLIKAFPAIHKKIGGKLLIVGEFYDKKDKYLDLIRETGLQDKIIVVDRYIPDNLVNDYFSAADILVLPYISATQSGITQIALSYNLPCVVTNVGGLPEVVKDGKTGFVVEPQNPETIAQKVIEYFTKSNRKIIRKNIQQEREKYSWDRMQESILSLYDEVS